MIVYAVYYGEGEPYAPVVLSLFKTEELALEEIERLSIPVTFAGYTSSEYEKDKLWVEEMEVQG